MTQFSPFSLNIRGRLIQFKRPAVMAIVNVTDDSFYAPSRTGRGELIDRVGEMLGQGADMIDLGACSTRPGSVPVDEAPETDRLIAAVADVRASFPDALLSVDTFRSRVASLAIEAGADIINDVSMLADPDMLSTLTRTKAPYILTHNSTLSTERDATAQVLEELSEKVAELNYAGVADVIIDPGFGFGKTVEQNYSLLANLEAMKFLELPILVGVSRKSMLQKPLGVTPLQALNATTVVNTLAVERGAAILRVHDVKEAVEVVTILNLITQ